MSTASRSSRLARHAEPELAIVGGGIGGLTLALALERRGVACRVFEQSPGFREDGVGLQLSPNATRLLHALGIGAELRELAVRPEAIELRDWAGGRRIFRAGLGETCERRFGAPLCTVRRKALHTVLRRALTSTEVVMGARLESLEDAPQEVTLRFADGSARVASAVVGADGLHSTVRRTLARDAPGYAGKAVYRGIVAPGPHTVTDTAIRVWTGPGQHCVAYPVAADGTVSFTAVVRAPDCGGAHSPNELLDGYRGWTAQVHELFGQAQSMRRWELYDRPSIRTWVSARVALLGDAAHAMLPFLAQGANAAIEDAYVLAGCLAESSRREVAPSLQRYQALRVPRTAKLQAEARARGQGAKPAPAAAASSYLDKQEWIFGYDAELAVAPPAAADVA